MAEIWLKLAKELATAILGDQLVASQMASQIVLIQQIKFLFCMQNFSDQLFSQSWPYLSHFTQEFVGIKEKFCPLDQDNLTSHLASYQLVSHNCPGQLFWYFWPYLSNFRSDFKKIKEKVHLLATSYSPVIAVVSFFAAFGNISAISSLILMGKKSKLVYSISTI